jgi:hypothetical protein
VPSGSPIVRIARCAWIGGLLAIAAPANADEEDARIREGVELRRLNRDEEALARFRAVWEQTHSAHARAQMGLAEQALGEWVLAEQHLAEALQQKGDSWCDKNRESLEASLREIGEHLGNLSVRANVAGATVRLDGRDAPPLPWTVPVRIVAGTVLLEVTAPGHHSISRVVAVSPGVLTREAVELTLRPPPPVPAAAVNAATSGAPLAAAPAKKAAPTPLYRRWWPWTIAGAVVVAGCAVAIGLAATTTHEPNFPPGSIAVQFP